MIFLLKCKDSPYFSSFLDMDREKGQTIYFYPLDDDVLSLIGMASLVFYTLDSWQQYSKIQLS